MRQHIHAPGACARRALIGLIVIAQLWAASTVVLAQPDDAQFQVTVDEGLAAFQAQRYAEARALFERAHALKPSARTLRALGLSAFALDDYTQAQGELEAALASQEDTLNEAQRREVQDVLDWMRINLGRIRLNYNPQEAVAELDGQHVARSELLIAAGTHRIHIAAPGYESFDQSFVIEASPTPHVFQIALRPRPEPAPAREDYVESSTWLWLGGGGLLLSAAGATAFGLGRIQIDRAEKPAPPFVLGSEGEAQARRGTLLTGIGITAGALGIAAIASALVLHFAGDREQRRPTAWRYELGPGQLRVQGSF